ncbi:MAG: heme-binding protein [Gammaproteobacteria bacterium]|nr:heme-binding protein [Gammaproteobacteria bacterium]
MSTIFDRHQFFRRNYYIQLLIIISNLVLIAVVDADEHNSQPVIGSYNISLDAATKAATAAVKLCHRQKYQVAVTVVNKAGIVKVVLRNDLVPEIALSISHKKAITALSFAQPTSMLAQRKVSKILATEKNLLFASGGLPIEAAGTIVGAIGVSGAPSGEIDEQCAKSGIDIISDDLKFFNP